MNRDKSSVSKNANTDFGLSRDQLNLLIDCFVKGFPEKDETSLWIFGSRARGDYQKYSDIDIAVISSTFKGDRYSDRRLIVPLRRGIDSRIEPIPFTPEDYSKGGMLIDEIKSTGQEIL